jgi:hypothetical protein
VTIGRVRHLQRAILLPIPRRLPLALQTVAKAEAQPSIYGHANDIRCDSQEPRVSRNNSVNAVSKFLSNIVTKLRG